MAVLVAGQQYGLKSNNTAQNDNKIYVFVKLTDSSLKAIQEYSSLKDKKYEPKIEFNHNNQGKLHIPSPNREHSFNFTLNLTADIAGPHGSFECVRQSYNQLESAGCMQFRMQIQAKEDVYDQTRSKLAAVEEEHKKMCTKVINDKSGPHARGIKGKSIDSLLHRNNNSNRNNKLNYPATRKPAWPTQQNGHSDKSIRRTNVLSSSMDSGRLHDSSNLDSSNALKRNSGSDMSLDLARKRSRPLPPRPGTNNRHSQQLQQLHHSSDPPNSVVRNENRSNGSDYNSVFNNLLGGNNGAGASPGARSHSPHRDSSRTATTRMPGAEVTNQLNTSDSADVLPRNPRQSDQNGTANGNTTTLSPGVSSENGSLSSPEIRQNETEIAEEEVKRLIAEAVKGYTTIETFEQRHKYRDTFNREYAEYMELHTHIEKVSQRFIELRRKLKETAKGSEGYKEIKYEILAEYDKNKKDEIFQERKRRFDVLHGKLTYVKQLVLDFDRQHEPEEEL